MFRVDFIGKKPFLFYFSGSTGEMPKYENRYLYHKGEGKKFGMSRANKFVPTKTNFARANTV